MLRVRFNVVNIYSPSQVWKKWRLRLTRYDASKCQCLSHDMENIAGTKIFCKGSRNELAFAKKKKSIDQLSIVYYIYRDCQKKHMKQAIVMLVHITVPLCV